MLFESNCTFTSNHLSCNGEEVKLEYSNIELHTHESVTNRKYLMNENKYIKNFVKIFIFLVSNQYESL